MVYIRLIPSEIIELTLCVTQTWHVREAKYCEFGTGPYDTNFVGACGICWQFKKPAIN